MLESKGVEVQVMSSKSVPLRAAVRGKDLEGQKGFLPTWINLAQFTAFPLKKDKCWQCPVLDTLLAPPDIKLRKPFFESWTEPSTLEHAEVVLEQKSSLMPLLYSETFPLKHLRFCGGMFQVPKEYGSAVTRRFGKKI